MSIETQVKRVTEASKNTIKTLLIKMGVTVGDESIDQYPTLAANAVAISEKQDKLSGSNGQIVGFNAKGEAVAQNANYAPSSHVNDGVKHITAAERSAWNAKLDSYTETDPTVPAWAKASSKPSYTASEVGATPASHANDTTAHITSAERTAWNAKLDSFTETDPTVPAWAKAANKPSYTASEVGLGNVDNVKQYSASNPPPYPVTSVNGQTGNVTVEASKPNTVKVTLTASGWDSTAKTQTVTATGVLADETAQLIQPTPALASQTAYYEAGILCTGQAADSLTFTATAVPTENLKVYVVIQDIVPPLHQ